MELRKVFISRKPTFSYKRKAAPESRKLAWLGGPVGVGEQGMSAGGPPGTWVALSFPPGTVVGEATTQTTLAWMGGTDPIRSEQPDAKVVPPTAANRGGRDERQGVGAASSSHSYSRDMRSRMP